MRSHILRKSIFAICLSAGACFAQENKAQFVKALEEGRPQTIVTYGTSLTAGGAWVPQLQQALNEKFPGKATVSNGGKGAMWSSWGVENLDARVLEKHPDAVIIEFSINDAFLAYKMTPESSRKNLENMIDRILAANPKSEIILAVMNPPIAEHLANRPDIEIYNQIYRDVAKDRKLMLIDYYPAWQEVLAQGEDKYRALAPDGIHPNQAGCETIITPILKKSIGL